MGAIMTRRRGDGELDPDGDVRERPAGRGDERVRGGGLGGRDAAAAGADDGAGDDYRDAADVAGLGEGGEQNAPLGRAVIGGLLVATVTTLLIVPIFYSGCAMTIARISRWRSCRSDGARYG